MRRRPAAAGQVCAEADARDAPTSTSSSASWPGPGDKLAIRDGHVVLNGKRQKEPFTEPCGGGEGCDFPTRDHDSAPITTS